MTDQANSAPAEQVVEVFTVEQLQILPQETKDCIVYLENNLPSKELRVLNPMVQQLLALKELENIVYVPGDKESIAAFKEAKKKIVAFNKLAGETKSAIKKPLDNIGKQVINIEKGVKSISESILAKLEESFKPYLDEEAAKKEEAEKRRREKDTAVITKLTQEQQEQADQMAKSAILNKIKHEAAMPLETKVNNALDTYGKEALEALANEVTAANNNSVYIAFRKEAEPLIQRLVLSDTDYIDACKIYQEKIGNLLKRINDKVLLLTTTETNKVLEVRQETIQNFGMFAVGDQNAPAAPEDKNGTYPGYPDGEDDLAGAVAQYRQDHPEAQPEGSAIEQVIASEEMDTNVPIQAYADFTDVPFFVKTDNEAGVDIEKELLGLSTKLNILKGQYTALYNEAKKRPGIELQTDAMHKLSGCVILIRKIQEYINN